MVAKKVAKKKVSKQKPNYNQRPNGCYGTTCAWSAPGGGKKPAYTSTACFTGSGDCDIASFVAADPSDFHDQHLMDATKKMRSILAKIPPDPRGRKLSFLHTNMGTLLAWVHHGVNFPGPRVTGKDDDATIAKALKLRLETAIVHD